MFKHRIDLHYQVTDYRSQRLGQKKSFITCDHYLKGHYQEQPQ